MEEAGEQIQITNDPVSLEFRHVRGAKEGV